MIDTVAPGRLRLVCAVAVVAAVLLSLISLCCCADVDPPVLEVGGTASTASAHGPQDGVSDAAGHTDPDCAQASDPEAAVPAFSHPVVVTVVPVMRVAVESAPEAGRSPGTRSRPPVPHLLCVMRT